MKAHPAMSVALVAGCAWLALAGCGSAQRGTPYTPPVQITDPAVAEGQKVFMAYCNQCHPGGAAGLGPALNNKPLPGWVIKTQVRKGLGAMPAFPKDHPTDQQLDDIVKYLKALRKL